MNNTDKMLSEIDARELIKMDNDTVLLLKRTAEYVRKTMVDMIFYANKDVKRRGHYGSSTSSVELYVVGLARLLNPWRDFIAWKPHASPVVYVLLYLLGELKMDDLKRLRQRNSPCQAYLNHWFTPMVQVPTGCMGFTLPYCCGRALADKIEGNDRCTFINMGDGEFTMPMSMEAIRFASMHRLNNFGIIVDDNRESMSGRTVDILGARPIEDYFRFFGWNVIVTDGHDIGLLWEAFSDFEREMHVNEKPVALVAKTDKWYGLPERKKHYGHTHLRTLTEEDYQLFQEGYIDEEIDGRPFTLPPENILTFFRQRKEILNKDVQSVISSHSLKVTAPKEMGNMEQAQSTLDAVRYAFQEFIACDNGAGKIIYVDPDLGAFPGLLPNEKGPNSVEAEAYSIKNPEGYVVRAGLSDPFAVTLSAGMGKDGGRYPIIPILSAFGLFVSEQVKQASLSGSRFLILGIDTNPWEGLTHQTGTSGDTAIRNLPQRSVNQWGSEWEFGCHVFVPCHPREARLLFLKCLEGRLLAYFKISNNRIPEHLLSTFANVSDEDFLTGGYIVGPRYDKPDLVIISAGYEVYTAIEASNLLRAKYPKIIIQVSVVSYLNLVTSDNPKDCALMALLAPSDVPLLRLASLPLDALGVARGPNEITCGTRYLTQSCSQEELAHDQKYDLNSVITYAEMLIKLEGGIKGVNKEASL